MIQSELDKFYLNIARDAAACSYCVKKQVGAIAAKGYNIIDWGFNGTPSGSPNVCEDINGNTLEEVIHAERNVICKCAREGKSLKDSTMYVTYAPCQTCASMIHAAGVIRVVYQEGNDKGGVPLLRSLGVLVEKHGK